MREEPTEQVRSQSERRPRREELHRRAMRVAVVRAGQIVEERLLRAGGVLSLGRSEMADVVVDTVEAPTCVDVIAHVDGAFRLRLTESMRGRLSVSGFVHTIDALWASGGGQPEAERTFTLDERTRGKIVIGELTLLFQAVAEPPRARRPRLPASSRGAFVKSIDWRFTACAAASYLMLVGFVSYLESADFLLDTSLRIPPQYVDVVYQLPPPPEEDASPIPPEVAVDEERELPTDRAPADRAERASADRTRAPTHGAEASPESSARIATELARAAVLELGAIGDGLVADSLREGYAAQRSFADIMADVNGVERADATPGALVSRGGGGSGVGGLGGLRAAGAAQATAGRDEGAPITEQTVTIELPSNGLDEVAGGGVFDDRLVVAMIRSRQSAFRRCYESSLRNDRRLSGRVGVRFTIVPQGTVTGAGVVENTTGDAVLGRCIAAAVGRLRFAEGPVGGAVTFEFPFIFVLQN